VPRVTRNVLIRCALGEQFCNLYEPSRLCYPRFSPAGFMSERLRYFPMPLEPGVQRNMQTTVRSRRAFITRGGFATLGALVLPACAGGGSALLSQPIFPRQWTQPR
jgi:hypothetical protein